MNKLKEKIKNNKIECIFIVIVCTLFLILTLDFTPKETKKVKEVKEEKETVKKVSTKIMVDIKGAVVNPGVYELKNGSRVIDVINMAGGLNKNADTSIINLSKKVEDEMAITIYTKEEIKKSEIVCEPCECPEISSACTNVQESTSTSTKTNDAKKEEKTTSKKISINTASLEELTTLDGIGDAKAKAIIGYRKTNGTFKKIEEIKNVSGIGDAIFEKIKDKITV